MGGGAPKKIMKKALKPVKKVATGVEKVAAEAFEELIEKPSKKIAKETGQALR